MARLVIHTVSGMTLDAPLEAWVVALINTLPPAAQQTLFQRVAQLDGASLIPDKYLLGTDALGTITMVERPQVDLGQRI